LFWPDAADSRQRLTVALSQLRSAAPTLVWTEWSRVLADIDCDAAQLREALTPDDPATAGSLAKCAAALVPGVGGNVPRRERLIALQAATESPRLGALREVAEDLVGSPATKLQSRPGHAVLLEASRDFLGSSQSISIVINTKFPSNRRRKVSHGTAGLQYY